MHENGTWFDSLLGPAERAIVPPRAYPPVLRAALLLALLYLGLALLSLLISRQSGSIAAIWFANAVAVAFILFAPAAGRWALWLSVSLAIVAANLIWVHDLSLALTFLLPNLCEIAIAVWLLRGAGLQCADMRSPASLLKLLLLGGVLPQMAGATLGSAALQSLGTSRFGEVWLIWFEGSVIGAVSMLPLAFVLLAQPVSTLRLELRSALLAGLIPLVVGVTVLALAIVPFPFIYIALPLLLSAMLLEPVAVFVLTALASLAVAVSLALGVFVPPPVRTDWEQSLVYLAYAAALVPAQLLASTAAAMRDARTRIEAQSMALQSANDRLEQFVRIASHDLREPLNTVAQFSQLLEHDHGPQLPADAREYLRLVRQSAGRMRRLLDDVLQYARLNAGAVGAMETVALDALFSELRESLASRIEGSRATVHVMPLPAVRGHPALLSLLFQNLLANGLKFMPPGRVPVLRVHARVEGRMALVTVEDNGIGIAEADIPRLFKPFQRLHLQRQYEGTGLGLTLCRQIVDSHGGDIRIESVVGEGTWVHVRLTLADARS